MVSVLRESARSGGRSSSFIYVLLHWLSLCPIILRGDISRLTPATRPQGLDRFNYARSFNHRDGVDVVVVGLYFDIPSNFALRELNLTLLIECRKFELRNFKLKPRGIYLVRAWGSSFVAGVMKLLSSSRPSTGSTSSLWNSTPQHEFSFNPIYFYMIRKPKFRCSICTILYFYNPFAARSYASISFWTLMLLWI
jgi:hypothetical protein